MTYIKSFLVSFSLIYFSNICEQLGLDAYYDYSYAKPGMDLNMDDPFIYGAEIQLLLGQTFWLALFLIVVNWLFVGNSYR